MCSGRLFKAAPLAAVVGIGLPAELRGDHHLAAEGSERFAHEFFVHERTVHFGGVEERDAAFHGSTDQRDHLLLVFGRAVGPSSFPCSRVRSPILPGCFFQVCASAFFDLLSLLIAFCEVEPWRLGETIARASDDRLAPTAAAEYLKGQKAVIIEIQGDAGGVVMMDRRDGFHEGIKGSGAQIVEGPYCDYIRANALTAMQDLLQAHPDVKVVYAHNDDMALGALQVLKEAGRNDVVVAGVDGLSEALKIMAEGGNFIATALNDPRYLGDVTIQTAIEVAGGKQVPEFVDAGTTLVTKKNVDQFKLDALFASYRPEVFAK